MARSVAQGSTLHCKLDSQLLWAAVRSIFWVGGESMMEIPAISQCPQNRSAQAATQRGLSCYLDISSCANLGCN
jgi:hypothetical protein